MVTVGCIILVVCPPCLETDELVYFLSKETHFFGLSPVSPLTAQLHHLVAHLVGTPFQVMNGQLDQLQQTLQAGTERRSPLPHRQNRRFDRERCQVALQAALDSNNEPRALRQIAQQLGFEDAHQLVYHFPEECKSVIQRAKAYRKQRKAQRLAQVREQVRQAVLSVHSQGEYPSQKRVNPFLPRALLLLPEERN